MRQRRWLELIKDYDCTISYHPGKANVVADALSRKERLNVMVMAEEVMKDLRKLSIEVCETGVAQVKLYEMTFQPELLQRIQKGQEEVIKEEPEILAKVEKEIRKDEKGIYRFYNRVWIPDIPELKEEILQEAHSSKFSLHPGSTKMYQDLKGSYWWPGMKKDISGWVNKCHSCQTVKAEHQRPSGLL